MTGRPSDIKSTIPPAKDAQLWLEMCDDYMGSSPLDLAPLERTTLRLFFPKEAKSLE